MRTQLYLPEMDKKYLKYQIGQFVDLFIIKLKPVFDSIDTEAEEHGNNFFNDSQQNSCSDDIDPADFAEQAMDQAIKHHEFLSHGRYVLNASWHVALYEAFEQQVRNYLFKELSHDFSFSIKHMYSRFDDLKRILIFYDIDIGSLKGLKLIDHLRLVCNLIKHGEGKSADGLRKKRPDLIKSLENVELLKLYGSSLLDEVINIDEHTLKEFGKAIEDFWDSFPERSFCESPDKLLEYINKKMIART